MQVGCFKPQLNGHNVDALPCLKSISKHQYPPFGWSTNALPAHRDFAWLMVGLLPPRSMIDILY